MNVVRINASTSDGEGVIAVPGSKSVANRALMIAALIDGTSTISRLPDGDDTEAMLTALTELGVLVEYVSDNAVQITGPLRVTEPREVSAQLAGTTSRFLVAMGCLSEVPITVTGEQPLLSRPIGELAQALRTLGFVVEPTSSQSLPLTVSCDAGLESIASEVSIRGDVSSQFISALMMIGPMLPNGLHIHVDGELVSRSYVEMTAQVMALFGGLVEIATHDIVVKPTGYKSADVYVEPDFSSAAFPLVGAVLHNKTVRIPGLAHSRLQGDARILEILKEMGAHVHTVGDDVVASHDVSDPIRPISVDMSDCSDLVPVVATLCTFADGVSELSGIGFIRAKESDRLGDLSVELNKTGANVEVLEDGLRIHPVVHRHAAVLDTHHDHRLAMSFALLGLRINGIEIRDPSVVSKSWPHYWVGMAPLLRAKTPRHAAVAFDLDNTLTIRDCVVPFLARCIGWPTFARRLLRNLPKITGFLVRRDRDGLKSCASRLVFAGRVVSDVRPVGEEFAEHVVRNWMRDDTCAVLKWHVEQGDDVVLVTASFDSYVHPLAQKMGISHVLCTQVETDGDTFTGELVDGNCRGPEKARRLAQWLGGRELMYAYGDSAGDDAMLAMATHPVRVGRRDVQIPVDLP